MTYPKLARHVALILIPKSISVPFYRLCDAKVRTNAVMPQVYQPFPNGAEPDPTGCMPATNVMSLRVPTRTIPDQGKNTPFERESREEQLDTGEC
jgi:hypothetical protein